jgi:hypothetical protein
MVRLSGLRDFGTLGYEQHIFRTFTASFVLMSRGQERLE